MLFQQLLTSFALLGAVAAAPATENEFDLVGRQVPSKQCSHITGGLHVIVLGGANTDNPREMGLLGSLAESILTAIPGSTNVSSPYDKRFKSLTPPTLYPGAVQTGMTTLKQYVVDYHHYCPNTKIAIIGYSSGAVIAMNDLCYGGNGQGTPQINPLLNGKIVIGAVMYGDETRVAGQTYDVGTCTKYNGNAARAQPGLCYPFASNLQSYCDNGDPDCCNGSPNPQVAIHKSYPGKYDKAATAFIVNKFKAAGGA